MLSQRYACPFLVLDEFIRLNQLHDFVIEIFKNIQKEKEDETRWEFFLHKITDKSFEEFVQELGKEKVEEELDKNEIKNVIMESQSMLDLF